jgi:hypothetical protein
LAEFATKEFDMRSYEAARNLFSFLALCSWAVIVLGGIVAFSGGTIAGTGFGRGASGMSALIGAAPGIILAMIGFYGLALVQMGRAGVDSAEYSQQALDVARKQLEVSQQALDQGKAMAASYAALKPAKNTKSKAKAVKSEPDSGPSYANRPNGKDVTASVPPAEPAIQRLQQSEETRAPASISTDTGAAVAKKALTSPEPVATVADLIPPERDPEPLEPVAKSEDATLKTERKLTRKEAAVPEPAPQEKAAPQPAPKEIQLLDGVYTYGNLTFSSEESAKRYVAQFGVNPDVKLPKT